VLTVIQPAHLPGEVVFPDTKDCARVGGHGLLRLKVNSFNSIDRGHIQNLHPGSIVYMSAFLFAQLIEGC
jgi:hypothetical protein